MAIKYIVISSDEPVGYIGTIEVEHPIQKGHALYIDEELHIVTEVKIKSGVYLYVNRIQRAELQKGEYESEMRQRTLGEFMDFIKKHRIHTSHTPNTVTLTYQQEFDTNRYQNTKSEGENLTEALCALRNSMISKGIIKRGEW